MDISAGSASEVDYLLYLSMELKYIDMDTYCIINSELTEIRKMLFGYIDTIRNS